MNKDENLITHTSQSEKQTMPSIMVLLLCVYMFLIIERPWEIWKFLQTVRLERVYMLFCLFFFVFWSGKQCRPSIQNFWICTFLALHYILAPFAYIPKEATTAGFEYFKMVVFYYLIIKCIRNEFELKFFIYAFITSMILYVSHSFYEFLCGRHQYTMGVVRMLGIDEAYGRPNSFSATINYSFPFLWALFKVETNKKLKVIFMGYFLLGVLCIILTNSRTGLLTLLLFILMVIISLKKFKQILIILLVCLIMPNVWKHLPLETQVRIQTIWDKNAGPEDAHESAQGRIEGLKASFRMFKQRPFTGVGAGGNNYIAYRVERDDGVQLQAHNLLGEVMAELGVFGLLIFTGHILTTMLICVSIKKRLPFYPKPFIFHLAIACQQGMVLLLFNGISGHNMYRYTYLLFAGWAVVAGYLSKWEYMLDS